MLFVFSLSYTVFHKAEVLNFNDVQLINCFFYGSSRFSAMLSCKRFIVLCVTFKSLIHFELIFLKGVRSIFRFMFCMWMSSCSSTICCEDCLYSHWIVFVPLWKISWLHSCGPISDLSLLFHWSICKLFESIPHCVDYYSFIVSLEVLQLCFSPSMSCPLIIFLKLIIAMKWNEIHKGKTWL